MQSWLLLKETHKRAFPTTGEDPWCLSLWKMTANDMQPSAPPKKAKSSCQVYLPRKPNPHAGKRIGIQSGFHLTKAESQDWSAQRPIEKKFALNVSWLPKSQNKLWSTWEHSLEDKCGQLIPKIQNMLSKFLGGKTLNKSINPDEAVIDQETH